MRITMPFPDVPGDNLEPVGTTRPQIMARSGNLIGFSRTHAVWSFGFTPNSEAANAYGVHMDEGTWFMWVLATHRGHITETYFGPYLELPPRFKRVIDSAPLLTVGAGGMN